MAPQDAAITKKRPMPRQACNRCHTAKLRCIQAPSSQRCHRCIKAGVECVHDPPQRLGRPRVNNISSPNNAPAKSTQRQENDGRASLVSESRWSTQDFDIAQTTGTAGTSPRSPVNVDSEEVAAGSMNGKGDQGSNSSDAEMGLFTGAQSQTAGLNFDIDLHQNGVESIQNDELCFFTDLLNPPQNLDSVLTPPLSMESNAICNDYITYEHPHQPAIHITSSDPTSPLSPDAERGFSDINCQDGPTKDIVLVLSQLTAKLSKIHRDLTGMTHTQSHLSASRRTGQCKISDECIKTQLRANIQAAEQVLEILGSVNGQSNSEPPEMSETWYPKTSNPFDRDHRRRSSSVDHRQREDASFSGLYSNKGNDYGALHSSTDPQDSITSMLVISIYLRLLQNFDILMSIMYMRLKECASTTRNPHYSNSGLAAPAHGTENIHNPALHVSMDTFSFSSPSAASLQVLFNVQLIHTFLAKVKVSIQRMISQPKLSGTFGVDPDPLNFSFSNEGPCSIPPGDRMGKQYRCEKVDHSKPPSHEVPRISSGSLAAGVYGAARGVLEEIDRMNSNIRGTIDAIQQWTIERT